MPTIQLKLQGECELRGRVRQKDKKNNILITHPQFYFFRFMNVTLTVTARSDDELDVDLIKSEAGKSSNY